MLKSRTTKVVRLTFYTFSGGVSEELFVLKQTLVIVELSGQSSNPYEYSELMCPEMEPILFFT